MKNSLLFISNENFVSEAAARTTESSSGKKGVLKI